MFHVKHSSSPDSQYPVLNKDILDLNVLVEGAKHLGLELDDRRISLFAAYRDHLLLWNARINLISRADEDRIPTHHFLDSLSGLPFLDLPPCPILLDLGSGAGFPGLPLRIVRPQMRIVLLDSKRKKSHFLESIARHLALTDIHPICARAEALAVAPEHRTRYHTVLARGISDLSTLLDLAWPLLRPGGALVAYKGPDVPEEIDALQRHARRATIAKVHTFPVPEEIDRITGKSRIIVRIHNAHGSTTP